jgi:ABC-type polysaccharide/polyol phosphate export permease
VVVFILVSGVTPTWTWLLFPVVMGLLLGLTVAVSMIVSSLYPRYRDVSIIWTVFSTVLFYATPILYTGEYLERHDLLRRLIMLNPLSPIFLLARKWFIQPSAPGPAAVAGGAVELLGPLAIYVGVCALAVWVFRREAPRIAEDL